MQTGVYTFATTNKTEVSVGDYDFEITAEIGDGSIFRKKDFTLTLFDQCVVQTLTLVESMALLQNTTYFYLERSKVLNYDLTAMIEPFAAQQECGPLTIEFSDRSVNTGLINSDIFNDEPLIDSD